jgi:hypothetical protein
VLCHPGHFVLCGCCVIETNLPFNATFLTQTRGFAA